MSLPGGWRTEKRTKKSARFLNDHYGLYLEIRGVHKVSSRNRHGATRTPTHYRVQLKQDWFAKGTLGDRETTARADSADEALAIAERFMQQFEQTRASHTDDVVETLHHSAPDHETAEELVDAIAATDTFAEAAGYSDELFRRFLTEQLGDGLLLAAHRVEDTPYTTGQPFRIFCVAVDDAVFGGGASLTM